MFLSGQRFWTNPSEHHSRVVGVAGICILEHTGARLLIRQAFAIWSMSPVQISWTNCINFDAAASDEKEILENISFSALSLISCKVHGAVKPPYGLLDRNEMGGIKYGWTLLVAGYSEMTWLGTTSMMGKFFPPKTVALNQKRTTTMIMTDMADNDGYIC